MDKNKAPIWTVVLSVFIGLFICDYIYNHSNFLLNNFKDRTIGVAIVYGTDIASRSMLYLKIFIIFSTIFMVSNKIFLAIWSYAKKTVGIKDLGCNNTMLFTLSTFSIFTLIFYYLNESVLFVGILDILKILLICSFLILIAKIVAKIKNSALYKIFNNYNLIVLSFMFPVVVSFIRWIVIKGSFIFTQQYIIVYFFLWFFYWISLGIFFKSISKKLFERKIISVLKAGSILLFIPISTILSNELQYSISNITNFNAGQLSIFIMMIILIISFIAFILNKSDNTKFKFAKNLYFPILISTITLFNLHTNYLSIQYLDTFHHGENLISTQQLFSFSIVPFINVFPTHGLSYMFSQILYSVINGYQPFAPWLWEWIPKIVEVTILYTILTKISNSFFSGLLITFLPIIGIFGGQALVYGYGKSLPTTYYFMPLSIGLILIWALRKLNFKSTLILWLSCLIMVVWRIDFGISSFVSAGLVLFVSIVNNQTSLSKKISVLKIAIRSFITSLIIGFLVLYTLCRIESVSILVVISQIFQFIMFQGQAQGLIQVINSYSPISIFQYLILPSVGVFYILNFIMLTAKHGFKKIAEYKTLLVFIASFSIIIFIRSFQRQTLAIMGYNPYLFAFLAIALPIYLSKKKSTLSLLIFTISLFVYQIILPNNVMLLKLGQQVTINTWHKKESRVKVDDYQYKKIVNFLNSNLDNNQTFLDLSSSPLLYVVSNRKFINYFIPNAYITSEIIQKQSLANIVIAKKNNEIPIVIFRQSEVGANFIDGIPNEIRSYRIFEYIYNNYSPVGNVDGYMIWATPNFLFENKKDLKNDINFKQEFNFGKLPYIWGNFDRLNAKVNTKVVQHIINRPVKTTNGIEPIRIVLNKHDVSNTKYIHLQIKSDEPGIFKLSLEKKPTSYITFDLIQSSKPEDYLIRISTLYEWTNENINSINLSSSVNSTIVDGYLREGD